MKKISIVIANILYTAVVIAVLALALLFVGTKINLFGYEAKVVQSGSMEPYILTGSLIVIAPAEQYRLGDVVTYGPDTSKSVPVTHRIVEKNSEGARAQFVTKGDANEDPDPIAVLQRDIIGKVMFSLPYLGYVIEFARTKLGFGLLIGIPALLIILDEFANITWEVHKYRHRRRQLRQGVTRRQQTSV